MKKEELKERLNQYKALDVEREQLARALDELEARMKGPRAANMDGMPHGSGAGDPVLNIVAQHIELLERYRAMLSKMAAAHAELETLIERLDPLPRSIMRARYLFGMTWDSIGETYKYSGKQVQRIHAKALDTLANELNKED